MTIADIPTDQLSTADKIALMERLWGELSHAEPPAWHDEALAARAEEWTRRHEVSEDWNDVRTKLGSRRK